MKKSSIGMIRGVKNFYLLVEKYFHICRKKPGFTLIEMLIVIVIIGVLSLTLIPRLTASRAKIQDTTRKAHLQQIATALIIYGLDNDGKFPDNSGAVNKIKNELASVGFTNIPVDPDKNNSFGGVGPGTANNKRMTGGQYGYTSYTKNGVSNGGFVLMAKTETISGSNRIPHSSSENIASSKTKIVPCSEIILTGIATVQNNYNGYCLCGTGFVQAAIRYIIVY